MDDDAAMDALFASVPIELISGGAAASAAAVPPHEAQRQEAQLQELRQQLSYKNAEATNLRSNLATVQSELAAAKVAAAHGPAGGGGRQDSEASRLRRELQQLRTKLEFSEQARREIEHAGPIAQPQPPPRRTTAAQTDRAELGARPALCPRPAAAACSTSALVCFRDFGGRGGGSTGSSSGGSSSDPIAGLQSN